MTLLFISDLHLEEKRQDITGAFLRLLQQKAPQADALYILGDFFEVWAGDDGMSGYHLQIARALRQLTDTGTRVFLLHGNRDFMLGPHFCQLAGCQLLEEQSVIQIHGQPVLLLHGDELCTLDRSYQRARRILRHPLTRLLARLLPLDLRQRAARRIRQTSRQASRRRVDVCPEAVATCMKKHGVRAMIHGHTHRPAMHELTLNGQQAWRMVLGDWDRRGWVLEISKQHCRLAPFPLQG